MTTKKLFNNKWMYSILVCVIICAALIFSQNIFSFNNVAHASTTDFFITEGMYDQYTELR